VTPRCAYRGCRRSEGLTPWRVCGERRLLCWLHDCELHEVVAMYLGDRNARRKSARYAASVIRKVNAKKSIRKRAA
jgi:hypothetical protein